jgi:mannose-1-phosphate guanylyltransferase
VKAVVLVGGFGTRLRPLTLTTPKQMLPVGGLPMIERVLGHLASHGIDEAVLSLGYRPDAFSDAYPDAVCAGVRLVYAVEPEPLDTAGAIAFAARLDGLTERFLVVNGDVLTDLDVTALVAAHEASGAEGTIALTQVEDPSHFGVVATDDDGRVQAFVEKPPPGEAPSDLVNAGFYVLEASVLGRIPAGRRVNVERETFPAMVADRRLYARPDAAYWVDVGTPERYLQANLDVLDGLRPFALEPFGPATVHGQVLPPAHLGEGVVVGEGAVVHRSFLGRGVVVGPGARVEHSVVLAGAVVGPSAVVRHSIVGVGALVGRDSVLGGLCVLGDGAETGDACDFRGVRLPTAEEVA